MYIKGPNVISGEIFISGSKNSALSIIFGTILTKKTVKIENIPNILDVKIALKILVILGAKIYFKKSLYIDTSCIKKNLVCHPYVKMIRASIYILGTLISRFENISLFLPGGCNLGYRPIDMHIKILRNFGASVNIVKDTIFVKRKKKIVGNILNFKKVSVGATINAIYIATLADGKTIINNPAKDPEILDTINFLNRIGAKIKIVNKNSKIVIKGVKTLKGCSNYKIIPDRIETATFLIAAAISKGKIKCYNTRPKLLSAFISKIKLSGAEINTGKTWVSLDMNKSYPKAVNINTGPYPEFPTDIQPQFTIMSVISKGTSVLTENIFKNRFSHIKWLINMGANIKILNNKIICKGVKEIFGKNVIANDLRCAASLMLAGCIAKGLTNIKNFSYLYRGYQNICENLISLGVKLYF
ncbi:MAG: UDP-N-acetylglucosamine 1-carboxyvinyltransferase [Enterobacteriaceae bacterium]